MTRPFANRPGRAALKQSLTAAALPQPLPDNADATIVTDWLQAVTLLQGIPPQWLVPDSTMLPPESIRVFSVDPNWLAALIQGATSIGAGGAVGQTIPALQRYLLNQPGIGSGPVSGFLMRSAIIGAFPALTITAMDSKSEPLICLRYEILAPNLAIALFAGQIDALTLQQPSSVIAFGADPDTPSALNYQQRYTNDGGGQDTVGSAVTGVASQPVPQRANPSISLATVGGTYEGPANTGGAVLDATGLGTALANSITPFTSAELALQLVQPTETVTVTITGRGAA